MIEILPARHLDGNDHQQFYQSETISAGFIRDAGLVVPDNT
jgi:hypothetical protein